MILVAGLSGAVLIYQTAGSDSNGVLGYQEAGGSYQPIRPEDSKKYVADLERYGGKANVLADRLRRWFVGLWHGKSLAFIVGGATILLSLSLFYAANHPPSRSRTFSSPP